MLSERQLTMFLHPPFKALGGQITALAINFDFEDAARPLSLKARSHPFRIWRVIKPIISIALDKTCPKA